MGESSLEPSCIQLSSMFEGKTLSPTGDSVKRLESIMALKTSDSFLLMLKCLRIWKAYAKEKVRLRSSKLRLR